MSVYKRCNSPGCINAERKAGLCWGHYRRKQKGLDEHEALSTQQPRPTPVQRLYEAALHYADAHDDDEYQQARSLLRRTAVEFARSSRPRPPASEHPKPKGKR